MHVIAECGAWERHGLSVDYDREIDRDDAHKRVITGDVEFVSGNHVSTYAARARGDSSVYLGQTVTENRIKLVTRFDAGIVNWKICATASSARAGAIPASTPGSISSKAVSTSIGTMSRSSARRAREAPGRRSRASGRA